MKLHDLKPNPGKKKERKRVGRGIAAGQGKTAGRGTKGLGARSGGGTPLWHQGGNVPFFRKLPFMRGKGNTRRNKVVFHEVNVGQLGVFKARSVVTPDRLLEKRLINDLSSPVVVLGRGDIDKPLEIHAHRVSKGAQDKIEAAGGSVQILEA
ncbi:MAG: 50S ribosomal protein L15 [Chloroflexota bacterium]